MHLNITNGEMYLKRSNGQSALELSMISNIQSKGRSNDRNLRRSCLNRKKRTSWNVTVQLTVIRIAINAFIKGACAGISA